MAEITSVALMYPNILHLQGDPMNLEHMKNANISEAFHVIIPCKSEENLSGNDCNAVIKANAVKQNWPDIRVSVEFSSNIKAALIENLLDQSRDILVKDGGSIYTSKSYLNGKIFSSVLFTRLSAMKSTENVCYETITSLLQYLFTESNIVTIEIPDDLRVAPKELTYGIVRDYLLLNDKIGLVALGVYAINKEDANNQYDITEEDRQEKLNASINKDGSVSDSDDELSFSRATVHEIGKKATDILSWWFLILISNFLPLFIRFVNK